MIPTEIRRAVSIAIAVCILILAGLTLAWCNARQDAKRSKAEKTVAVATGKALDKVAEQTPVIRQEQQEKQREVDQIEGSDTRLPDGYGRKLECLRSGKRDCDS